MSFSSASFCTAWAAFAAPRVSATTMTTRAGSAGHSIPFPRLADDARDFFP